MKEDKNRLHNNNKKRKRKKKKRNEYDVELVRHSSYPALYI